jgi:hypothetical protein
LTPEEVAPLQERFKNPYSHWLGELKKPMDCSSGFGVSIGNRKSEIGNQ